MKESRVAVIRTKDGGITLAGLEPKLIILDEAFAILGKLVMTGETLNNVPGHAIVVSIREAEQSGKVED